MKIIMDGREVAAEPGQTILEVARQNDVYIPTLCHFPGLEPAAMCRLCTVELVDSHHRVRLVTACNYPLRGDTNIVTDSQRLRQGRKLTIELLHTRCPDSELLQQLAERYGAELGRFPDDNKDCIMCGLCTRACERVGGNVLTLSGRGVAIRVGTAFNRTAQHCLGCGACANICPVKKIQIRDEAGERVVIIYGKEASRIKLRTCESCGQPFGPLIDLERVMERAGEARVRPFNAGTCPACSRRRLARTVAQRHSEQYEIDAVAAAEEK